MGQGGRLRSSWNPHLNDEERVVPFTDPSQVAFIGYLQREVLRIKRAHRYDAALINDIAESLGAAMTFLDGAERTVVYKEGGKRVIQVLKFRATKLEREEDQQAK